MSKVSARKPFWKMRVRGYDPVLFWLAMLASGIGLFFIFNAGYPRSISSGRGPISKEVFMQAGFLFVGYMVWRWAAVQPQEKWLRLSKTLWWLCVVALVAVMLPVVGLELNGAHRWINFRLFTIQPAEFAKVFVVLFLAGILATRKAWPTKFKRPKNSALYIDNVAIPKLKRIMPAVWVGLAFGLIAIEPDLGTAAVIGFVGYVMFAVGGITRKSLVVGTVVIAVLGVAFVRMESYRLDRIANHFHRWEAHNVDGIAYQTVQSELAMASGGIVGQGIGNGRAKHVLPAATTDFITATVAEELGLAGWLFVAGVLGLLTYRLLALSRYATTKFGSMVLLGVGTWIGIQAVTNLMMANGTLPPIGIPLPFISYGGSSLVALWLAMGISQSVLAPHMAVVQTQEEDELEAGRDGRRTGGHVFPALEVARVAKGEGADLIYLGSNRGQESSACHKAGITFRGFGSQPLYSLKSVRGWRGLSALLRARQQAKRVLKRVDPDVVFSTGGYAAGPVVSAAQALGIPTVLHEQNSVPGRSNLMFARRADMICTTFHSSEAYFEGCRTARTGMPNRKVLRDVADGPHERDLMPLILVVGSGSQGAQPLNEAVLAVATRLVGRPIHWLHVTGKQHFEAVFLSFEKLGLKYCYEVKAYLEAEDMAMAYARASLVVGRSGAGTLAELAMFRLPSVVVPYPLAYANHQAMNAAEFEEMGATHVIDQSALSPGVLEQEVLAWTENPTRCEEATAALGEWDSPNAADQIMEFVKAAGS